MINLTPPYLSYDRHAQIVAEIKKDHEEDKRVLKAGSLVLLFITATLFWFEIFQIASGAMCAK